MIKRTLYFGNPVYLSKKESQLVLKYPKENIEQTEELIDLIEFDKNEKYKFRSNQNSIPIEDIGVIVLDNQQITISHGLMSALLENNVALITCNSSHLPTGLLLTLDSNQIQSKIFQAQIEATEPLKKQLWQQTISAKIFNQAQVLGKRKKSNDNMKKWSRAVKSGDTNNLEGRASAYYWKNIFPEELQFERDRYGEPPNNILNYGYAILRAVVARGLVSSGLLPTLGIHHHNQYNAYCLADDIMEPYRPFVDDLVASMVDDGENIEELTPEIKKKILTIPATSIEIDDNLSPLMVGLQRTTSSLSKCFLGETRKIIYPVFKTEITVVENNTNNFQS